MKIIQKQYKAKKCKNQYKTHFHRVFRSCLRVIFFVNDISRRTTAEQEVLALIAPLGKLIVTH